MTCYYSTPEQQAFHVDVMYVDHLTTLCLLSRNNSLVPYDVNRSILLLLSASIITITLHVSQHKSNENIWKE